MIRKLGLVFLLLAGMYLQVVAQHYVGVRGGFGAGSFRPYPKEETGMVWGLWSGGVSWKYYSPIKFVGGVEADIEYMQRAYKYELKNTPDTTYQRSLTSIMVPLFWQPHAYLFNRHMRVFLNLGLTFSYNFNSHYKYVSRTEGMYENGKYEMQLTRDNRWNYGLCGGFGLGLLFGRWEALIEGRYYFGYADILKNRNKYPYNPLRSPLDNINFSVGLSYRLGKGKGLLIDANMRAAARQAERDALREAGNN